jgi:branched-chain amino acid transport system ATP-binding protein
MKTHTDTHTAALSVTGLTKNFGGLLAIDQVSLDVAPGERLAIIGPNGAGKTTFFHLLTGVLPPSAGQIRLFGQDVTRLPIHRRARLGLARTFQISTLFPELTVVDSVLLAVQAASGIRFALHRALRGYRPLYERADALLHQWGLAHRRDAPVKLLSYGEQRQLELVLALAGTPKVLLLDEPTAGLAPAETSLVVQMIERLPPDITIVLIEHDMDVAFGLAHKVAVFAQGRLLTAGTREEIRQNPDVVEIYLGTDDA